MAKEKIKKDNELVVKDNELILIGNRFDSMNITQMKIMNLIIANFDNRLQLENIKESDLIFSIPYNVLIQKLQEKELKATRLKEYIQELNRKQWRETKEDGDWLDLNIFSYATYKKGTLEMKLNRDLVKYFLELGGSFTKYYFDNIARFKSKYSILLYELLKSQMYKKEATFTIDELLVFLKVEALNMKPFGNFNKYILKKIQIEINETSDIQFEYIPNKKEGTRKEIESITFRIKKNTSNKNEYRELREFIKFVRLNYVNQLIFSWTTEKETLEISVNHGGYLYFINSSKEITKEKSEQVWQYLFENQELLEKYTKALI